MSVCFCPGLDSLNQRRLLPCGHQLSFCLFSATLTLPMMAASNDMTNFGDNCYHPHRNALHAVYYLGFIRKDVLFTSFFLRFFSRHHDKR
ncbi:hypothetical protein B0H14DRAFT_2832446 [Mycena olivaceomarginata]|nr:hypothetical protein B0H14DRAFT_2832446 [Mycena olivaceomarginata]